MNIMEVAEKKDKILKPDNKMRCNKCGEQYFSPFDKLYISVKGICYICDSDDLLSENIFKLL